MQPSKKVEGVLQRELQYFKSWMRGTGRTQQELLESMLRLLPEEQVGQQARANKAVVTCLQDIVLAWRAVDRRQRVWPQNPELASHSPATCVCSLGNPSPQAACHHASGFVTRLRTCIVESCLKLL